MTTLKQVHSLLAEFERKHFQGSAHVTFYSSRFTWGRLAWRDKGPLESDERRFEFTDLGELAAYLRELNAR